MKCVVNPAPYHLQTLGKLYVEMGRFTEAKVVLEKLAPNPFGLYWLAKAHLGNGDALAAKNNIELAISSLDGGPKYRSTFLATARSQARTERAGRHRRSR
jgi:hypothetical protein